MQPLWDARNYFSKLKGFRENSEGCPFGHLPKPSDRLKSHKFLVENGLPIDVRRPLFHMSLGRSTPCIGDGQLIPPLMTGILIMGPYKPLRNWVDEFIPYYMELLGV